MTSPDTILIDAVTDPIPENGVPVAFIMRWDPLGDGQVEERRLSLLDVTPADDRLSMEIAGVGTAAAIQIGAPTSQLIVWFVGARQMRLKREPWRKLEHLFTLRTLRRSEFFAEVELSDDDDEGRVVAGDLDAVDLDRGDDTDPTPAPST